MAAAPGPGPGAASSACAACKYQRRRCTAECPLAEYFPHDQPRVFRNAHRLFGVSNILKTLAVAGPVKRDEAMRSIIFESQAWDLYPSSGCIPIILELQRRVRQAEIDLQQVQDAIQAYRILAAPQQPLVPEQQDHRDRQLLIAADATSMMVPLPPHQSHQQPVFPVQPQEDMEMMTYILADAGNEMPRESSSSIDSSKKQAMKAPKMEDAT